MATRSSSAAAPPSRVPWRNRHEAPRVEPSGREDGGSSRVEASLRSSWPSPRVRTGSVEETRRDAVGGDSLLKGAEGPTCRPDPLLREVCCSPGAQVKDMTRKPPTPVRPSDYYYPLLVLHVGGDDVATRSARAIERDFQDAGLREQEHKQCSPLPFQWQGMMREGTGRASRSIPGSEPGVTGRICGFLIMGQST